MKLDREKTVLQETGTLTLFPGHTLRDLVEIVLDLGIDPAVVRCSSVTLTVDGAAPEQTP